MIELIKEELENAEILLDAARQADNFPKYEVQNAKIELLKKLIKNHGDIHHVSGSNFCKQCKEPIERGFRFCSGECKQYYYRFNGRGYAPKI